MKKRYVWAIIAAPSWICSFSGGVLAAWANTTEAAIGYFILGIGVGIVLSFLTLLGVNKILKGLPE